jgi:hypothetical protein
MQVVNVPFGTKGFDTDTTLTPSLAQQLQPQFGFVVRYLSALSTTEINDILGSGLWLELVNFAHKPGWLPTASMGTADGQKDVQLLKQLGIPQGMELWIDLEGSAGSVADTTDWINSRALQIVSAGYLAGLYVGNSCVLDGPQLYALPNISRYWQAYNQGIPEPQCGFCQFQLFPPNQTVSGVLVDLDYSSSDYKGRVPIALMA